MWWVPTRCGLEEEQQRKTDYGAPASARYFASACAAGRGDPVDGNRGRARQLLIPACCEGLWKKCPVWGVRAF